MPPAAAWPPSTRRTTSIPVAGGSASERSTGSGAARRPVRGGEGGAEGEERRQGEGDAAHRGTPGGEGPPGYPALPALRPAGTGPRGTAGRGGTRIEALARSRPPSCRGPGRRACESAGAAPGAGLHARAVADPPLPLPGDPRGVRGDEEAPRAYDRAEAFDRLGLTDAETPRGPGGAPRRTSARGGRPAAPGGGGLRARPSRRTSRSTRRSGPRTRPPPSVADPKALQGGTLRLATRSGRPPSGPTGPTAASPSVSDLQALVYETLLGHDADAKVFVPGLASHWQVGEDRRTYRFRLDPDARWADGREVTADDVVATFEHLRNPDRKDPSIRRVLRTRPSRRCRRSTAGRWSSGPGRRTGWPSTGSAATLIFPAAWIRMDGETYLQDWNWKLPPGSGPYEMRPGDMRKGQLHPPAPPARLVGDAPAGEPGALQLRRGWSGRSSGTTS